MYQHILTCFPPYNTPPLQSAKTGIRVDGVLYSPLPNVYFFKNSKGEYLPQFVSRAEPIFMPLTVESLLSAHDFYIHLPPLLLLSLKRAPEDCSSHAVQLVSHACHNKWY